MEAPIIYRGSIGFIMFLGWFGSLSGICRVLQGGQGFKWLVLLMGLQLCELCFRACIWQLGYVTGFRGLLGFGWGLV